MSSFSALVSLSVNKITQKQTTTTSLETKQQYQHTEEKAGRSVGEKCYITTAAMSLMSGSWATTLPRRRRLIRAKVPTMDAWLSVLLLMLTLLCGYWEPLAVAAKYGGIQLQRNLITAREMHGHLGNRDVQSMDHNPHHQPPETHLRQPGPKRGRDEVGGAKPTSGLGLSPILESWQMEQGRGELVHDYLPQHTWQPGHQGGSLVEQQGRPQQQQQQQQRQQHQQQRQQHRQRLSRQQKQRQLSEPIDVVALVASASSEAASTTPSPPPIKAMDFGLDITRAIGGSLVQTNGVTFTIHNPADLGSGNQLRVIGFELLMKKTPRPVSLQIMARPYDTNQGHPLNMEWTTLAERTNVQLRSDHTMMRVMLPTEAGLVLDPQQSVILMVMIPDVRLLVNLPVDTAESASAGMLTAQDDRLGTPTMTLHSGTGVHYIINPNNWITTPGTVFMGNVLYETSSPTKNDELASAGDAQPPPPMNYTMSTMDRIRNPPLVGESPPLVQGTYGIMWDVICSPSTNSKKKDDNYCALTSLDFYTSATDLMVVEVFFRNTSSATAHNGESLLSQWTRVAKTAVIGHGTQMVTSIPPEDFMSTRIPVNTMTSLYITTTTHRNLLSMLTDQSTQTLVQPYKSPRAAVEGLGLDTQEHDHGLNIFVGQAVDSYPLEQSGLGAQSIFAGTLHYTTPALEQARIEEHLFVDAAVPSVVQHDNEALPAPSDIDSTINANNKTDTPLSTDVGADAMHAFKKGMWDAIMIGLGLAGLAAVVVVLGCLFFFLTKLSLHEAKNKKKKGDKDDEDDVNSMNKVSGQDKQQSIISELDKSRGSVRGSSSHIGGHASQRSSGGQQPPVAFITTFNNSYNSGDFVTQVAGLESWGTVGGASSHAGGHASQRSSVASYGVDGGRQPPVASSTTFNHSHKSGDFMTQVAGLESRGTIEGASSHVGGHASQRSSVASYGVYGGRQPSVAASNTTFINSYKSGDFMTQIAGLVDRRVSRVSFASHQDPNNLHGSTTFSDHPSRSSIGSAAGIMHIGRRDSRGTVGSVSSRLDPQRSAVARVTFGDR
jgi:hypothetical protein